MKKSQSFFAFTLTGLVACAALVFSGCRSNAPAAATTQLGPAAPHSYPENQAPDTQSHPFSPISPDGAPSRFGGAPEPTVASREPSISAKCAILVDGRGRVIYEKNASARVPVASTQKLLLGILIVENGNLGKTIMVEESDTWAEPTVMGLQPGQTYTREELLHAVLIRSSNDIARCLARDHSGSVSAFAAAMNQRARQLGMNNSYFTNASGLPSPPGQYSTAHDLAILGAAAMQKPFIRNAVGTKAAIFRFSNGTTKTIYNTNQVLKSFPYCTGAKTGYTNAAGRCLVSAASNGGKSCIAVILGSKSPNVWSESEELLRYGLGM